MVLSEKTRIKILTSLSVIAVFVWIFVFIDAKQDDILEIDFFDIGQGDSIFIETPNKKQILIDGGPDKDILEKLGKEMSFYDRHIDLVILTHPEHDHINGLVEVIKRYEIGAIIATGVVRDTSAYKEWVRIIEQKNIPIYIAQMGGIIDLGNDIQLKIFYPFKNLAGKEVSNTNNSSIVGKLVYKDFKVLLTGDIEKSIERELVNSNIDLTSDILKVAHHGSKTSSNEEFLTAVKSVVNVVQAGKDNKYSHPHDEVVSRMANVLVTGWMGNIEILSDGRNFKIPRSGH